MDAKKQEVNRIKKNPSQYLYVEMLDSIEDVAITKAQHYLAEEIDNYVAEQKSLKNSWKKLTALCSFMANVVSGKPLLLIMR